MVSGFGSIQIMMLSEEIGYLHTVEINVTVFDQIVPSQEDRLGSVNQA